MTGTPRAGSDLQSDGVVRRADVLPPSYASFFRAASAYGLREKDREFDGMNVWQSFGRGVQVKFY